MQELQRVLAQPSEGIRVVDVREAHEAALLQMPGATLLPLSQLESRWRELSPEQTIYVCCQSGIRSMQAVRWLNRKGFKSVKSVRGGLQAWARETVAGKPR